MPSGAPRLHWLAPVDAPNSRGVQDGVLPSGRVASKNRPSCARRHRLGAGHRDAALPASRRIQRRYRAGHDGPEMRGCAANRTLALNH
jgi:hypothetical protein